MSSSIVNSKPYPFHFEPENGNNAANEMHQANVHNVRGKRPSPQASRLRTMMLEAWKQPSKIVAMACSFDALSSKLAEQAGFPVVFLSGFPVAGSLGLPDTGYIAFGEMSQKVAETARQVQCPILVDGDTGYGGPMNVKRAVYGFALAGAAGVMIEDQTWPKRCGHTQGKAVVPEDEAYARLQAAVDARNEGIDIWILGRTDSLIHGYDEALKRARRYIEIGVDAVFIEAVPDRATMERFARDLNFPMMANIIPGGRTEAVSAASLANMGYSAVVYPFTILAAAIQGIRESLEDLKESFTSDTIPRTLPAADVMEAVGFPQYYQEEERYAYSGMMNGTKGYQWENKV
ncbi:hypothetical protein LTR10_017109 [Elasticomyces elasticus]|uniref:Carboxyvinyl-carboxyphosphonate phosphorylmutase n=1 Tax=Exophiala sideris TaxID=1016849 RepID=A0ABR0JFZ4_9EURO|nr:hypothetical protein LTR10_017109 [Elasticomyces elasticus]KAK5032594.1 hypothetical protein LTS07_004003 [Exophiala sideris]KAK5037226.1 hypothetical protein LTR13_005032 [Exophiala sideris]KAK5062119.1 hypothetical protein LTR69_004476 [Exophiala sideris]KAK5182384.1 hypothetical protein LTR44_005396 [Eurotiomycetes sp. CCFEE 6388]